MPPHAHTGLMDNTTYYYRLTANSSLGASAPTEEVSATPQAQISARREYTCAVVEGAAECWGEGSNGRLGNNATESKKIPVPVSGL